MPPISFKRQFNHNGKVANKLPGWIEVESLGWESTVVTTRLDSQLIVQTLQFYRSNHRSWSNPGDISLSQSYARQFSSLFLQSLPRVVSTPNTIKNLGPFARNSTIWQVPLSIWCQSIGSNSPGFCFYLDLLDPSWISVLRYDHSVAH